MLIDTNFVEFFIISCFCEEGVYKKLDLMVVASRVVSGRKKDGSSFHFCRVWVELDDGSLFEMPAKRDYVKGDVITCDLVTYGNSLRLNERG